MVFRSLLPSLENSLFGSRSASPFLSLQNDMGRDMARLFDEVLRATPGGVAGPVASMALRLDVKEDDKAFTVTADLPGMTEKDVEITFENDLLTIRGEKKAEADQKVGTWHLVERSSGSFARRIALPSSIDENKIDASFANGVLTVLLPKKPSEETRAKKITIKAK